MKTRRGGFRFVVIELTVCGACTDRIAVVWNKRRRKKSIKLEYCIEKLKIKTNPLDSSLWKMSFFVGSYPYRAYIVLWTIIEERLHVNCSLGDVKKIDTL